MNIDFHDFKGETFSFHDDPVLVLENFWGAAERQHDTRCDDACEMDGVERYAPRLPRFPQFGELEEGRYGSA